MAWANRHPVLMWTSAWGITGVALYISGVFNSPRTGPLWVAVAGGMISWSIAGTSTFSKHWNLANLVIWSLAYLLSFALAGFLMNMSFLRDTIMGLFLALMGWSGGMAFGAFASTWLASDHPRLMQSGDRKHLDAGILYRQFCWLRIWLHRGRVGKDLYWISYWCTSCANPRFRISIRTRRLHIIGYRR